MIWVKRGLIIVPAHQAPWIGTHAALPVVRRLDNRDRVYFSSRDAAGRSHIGYADLSLDSGEVLAFAPDPILSPGRLGTFDDAGVTSSCVIDHGHRTYCFYTGWALGKSVPFYLNTGLACSDDGGLTFQRVSPAPLLDRNAVDPYLTASPWVIVENGTWRMWYVSGTEWTEAGEVAFSCFTTGTTTAGPASALPWAVSEVRISRVANAVAELMLKPEWWLIKAGISMPIGSSLMVVARRPAA